MARSLRCALALLMVTLACRDAPRSLPPARHNILLVTIDTLRADRLHRGLTPTLDALASRGVSFANARTVAPLTLPAHVSIMTGLLPPSHGVQLNGVPVSGAPRTLAARLKEAGYQTGAVVGAFVLDRRFGLDAGFETYDDRIARDPNAVDRLSAERRAGAVVDASVAWLDGVDRSRPWMLWTHLYDPHAPYDAPDALVAATGSDTERAYNNEVAYVDRELGRLIAAADRVSSPTPTAVIATGDHGESLGEHGEPTHGMLVFEGALRVPLIVQTPSAQPREVREPVSLVDIMPTTLALAGLATHDGVAGRNLLGALDADREIYAETEYPTTAGWSPVRTLVQDRWKAVSSVGTVLFDLSNDPGEATDVAPTRRSVVDAMRERIDSVRTMGTGHARNTTQLSTEASERLRALGYVSPKPTAGGVDAPGIDPATRIEQWAEFERALSELTIKDTKAAVLRLQKLASINSSALFQSTYARALAESGRARDALEVYRTAVSAWPMDAALYHELAVAARDAGRHEEAMRAEQASLTLDVTQPAAQNGLGLLLVDAGRHQDAARAFAEAVALDPTSAPYRANLANARRATNDLAGAADAYRQALDRDPNLADAANGLGVVLVQQQRAVDAIPWLERALTIEPDFVEARLNLGIAWQESGNRARAVEHYRAVLATKGPHARERDAARALLAQLGQP